MAGLLDGVLPHLFSQGDRAKRYAKGLLSDPVGTVQQTLGHASDQARASRGLLDAAFAPNSATKVADKQAFNQLTDSVFNTATGFAPAGMIAWHGSPHVFNKFDASKIGTGEGAQAYGHGLYLAESPDVARSYKTSLEGKIATLDRRDLQQHDAGEAAMNAAKSMFDMGYSEDAIAAVLQQAYKRLQPELAKVAIAAARPGALYKVDLPDSAVARMLDWDAPLSQQAADVAPLAERLKSLKVLDRDAFGEAGSLFKSEADALANRSMRGADLYNVYRREFGGADMSGASAAELLRKQGIPGVRYLDGGSRGAADGTRNFVMFPGEESLLTILERNGVPLGR